ncbi:hypothetical protein [Neobacillus sp. CF12]|uniref:hypothetical protein n=1 Tax=Neobacillus sp. CF12 TaxID=3055864 RepID=UPI0025A108E3|nr:hypothetical protein [Neobacillus sp. CF12]MDM5326733.1 hypothetical protein [Neobacillus sp. CF12]
MKSMFSITVTILTKVTAVIMVVIPFDIVVITGSGVKNPVAIIIDRASSSTNEAV